MKNAARDPKLLRQGQTLVATMIVIVILMLLAVALFKGSSMFGVQKNATPARADGHGTTVLGAVRYDAKDTVCRSNLAQVRQAIQLFESTNDDQKPQSLTDLKIGSDFYNCPIDHEPYSYDPATGQVHCVHPGHETY